jgi:glucose/arabinose dehydrogenase
MIPSVWNSLGAGVLALVLVAQTITTQACPKDPTTPSGDPFTTSDGVRFRVDTVATGLEGVPWAMEFAPDGRLFVTERIGLVLIVNVATGASEIALSLDGVFADSEAGMLGLALDPQFSQNHFVYLYVTQRVGATGAVNRILRFREVNNRLGEMAVLLDGIPAASIHDGGRLKFGPDGLLYATTGDAATQGLAQDVSSLAGKILRINRDGTTPRDNRFSSPMYSYGHRNPQGIDWHPTTGTMWSSEHGNIGNDEINQIQLGLNFGWPRIQGSETMPTMEAPLTSFSPAIAPSGATFYRGGRIPQFTNNFFVATLRGTHLLRVTVDSAGRRITAQERMLEGAYGRLRDAVMGPDGHLYFVTNNRDGRGTPAQGDDRILRIAPAL